MKIAFIGTKGLPARTGVDGVVQAILRVLNSPRYKFTVYCSSRIVPIGTLHRGVTIVRIPSLPGKHLNPASLFLFSAIHALLFGDYDLIHMHNVEASFILPLLRIRYKVITTSHGSAYIHDKWSIFIKVLIRLTEYPFMYLSNSITCVSQPLTSYYQTQYGRKVNFIPNGVYLKNEIDIEGAKKILENHGVHPGTYILFAAGRILPIKGCHLLIEAFQSLEFDNNLLIIGDPSHQPEYAKTLLEMADKRVKFVPFIASKELLFGIVTLSRFFVFPSTREAMSSMLLEVISLGMPIICSDIPENRIILDDDDAVYFKSGNVQSLAKQLEWAINHPDLISQMGDRAQKRVKEQFSWDKIAARYAELYWELNLKQ